MRIKILLFCFGLLLLFPLSASGASLAEVEKSFKQGQEAYKAENFEAAAKHFIAAGDGLAALKDYDKARAIYGNASVVLLKQEKWQEAYDLYAKALALPGNAAPDFRVRAAKNMALCADNLGRNDLKADAISPLFKGKIDLPPAERLNFLSMLGDAQRAQEQYALACQSYEQALALKEVPKETRVTLLVALGLSQGNLGRYPQALASLESAAKEAEPLKLELAMVEATSNIGILYWEMGQYAKAAQSLEKAIDYSGKFQMLRHQGVDANNMGLVYKSAGKLNDAAAQVDRAVSIAVQVKNRRDEAIALSNRALIARMRGDNQAARKDYDAALAAYREVKFREGEASALMGLAKMDTDLDKNYQAALGKLEKAAAIYEELDNPGFLAEAYVQLGRLYQKMATPDRKSRDLVFEDDEPEGAAADPKAALAQSREYFSKAKTLADKTGRKEMQWSAMHGLAFAEREAGNLAQAEKHYAEAIKILLSMKGGDDNPELLQDMLHDKDDLFAEAIDVCAKLYQQNKDESLLKKQMEYDDIYQNEVLRANMKLASVSYLDPAKKALFDEVTQAGASMKKADAAAKAAAASSTESAKAETILSSKEASAVAKEFENKLAQWKKQYPADAVVFDSTSTLNIQQLQAGLGSEQAIVQYIPLENSLVIMTITKEAVNMSNVDVSYRELADLIRDKLIAENIELFGRAKIDAKKGFEEGVAILEKLSSYLYMPVKEHLAGKSRLYFTTSKYLSYVPFPALVIGRNADNSPIFLVEEKTTSFARLSMMPKLIQKTQPVASNRAIVVGNPLHSELIGGLQPIEGAEKEAVMASDLLKANNYEVTLLLRDEAKENVWKDDVSKGGYSVMYFATHGVPFAEMMYTANLIQKRINSAKGVGSAQQKFYEFYAQRFQNRSHLNGFLYMAYPGGNEDGVLTLKEILEMPDSVFANARIAILSACNTAVSYSPKVIKDKNIQEELEEQEASKEMVEAGWTPGVDQASLTDTFLRRNFTSVYGTLWFADDKSSADIMGNFVGSLKDMTPAEALRDAQLKYLKNPSYGPEEYPTHPFFWACGNIFGQ